MTKIPKLKDVLEIIVQSKVEQTDLMSQMGLFGMYSDGKIYIEPNLPVRQKVETLIHEALHGYYFSFGEGEVEAKVKRETSRLMRQLYR